jgi:hypothetical protein
MDLPSKMLLHPDNTARPVDARWRRIVDLCRNKKPRKHRHDDSWVRDGLRYLQQWDKCEAAYQFERLTIAMPDFDAAHRLRRGDDRLARARLEAQLLAGRTIGEAAATCGLSAETVRAYEAVHFQVIGRRDASAFIYTEAIGMSVLRPLLDEFESETFIKLMGFQRGFEFSEAGYRYFRGGVQVPERLEEATTAHLEELAALLRVRAFIATRVASRRGSPHAERITEVMRSLERYVARGRLQPARPSVNQAGGGLGLDLPVQVPADVPTQDKQPQWWPAIRNILHSAA